MAPPCKVAGVGWVWEGLDEDVLVRFLVLGGAAEGGGFFPPCWGGSARNGGLCVGVRAPPPMKA